MPPSSGKRHTQLDQIDTGSPYLRTIKQKHTNMGHLAMSKTSITGLTIVTNLCTLFTRELIFNKSTLFSLGKKKVNPSL
jgi:hypothetical protein